MERVHSLGPPAKWIPNVDDIQTQITLGFTSSRAMIYSASVLHPGADWVTWLMTIIVFSGGKPLMA